MTGVLAASALAGIAAGVPAMASANTAPAAPVAKPASVAAASIAQTFCWGNVSDGAILYWYNAPVSAGQSVAVSASEANAPYGNGEFLLNANVYSEGVAVLPAEIQVRVHTGWGSPIEVCLHYIG